MNWLQEIIETIKWKIEDAVWAIKDKIQLNNELKNIDKEWQIEELEIKPKKKAKKKSAKKTKKSV